MKKFFVCSALSVALLVASVTASAQEPVPKHVEFARTVVANVKPENNLWISSKRYLKVPKDSTGEYAVRTDCVGFIESVLDQGGGIKVNPSTKKYSDRYSIVDYVAAIDKGEVFTKLARVQDLKVGDLVAWSYLKKAVDHRGNGHIVLVDSVPVKVSRYKPRAKGLDQWEVRIMDSNSGPTSEDDTRYLIGTSAEQAETSVSRVSGAGRGKIYIYTDYDGVIKAAGYGFEKSRVQHQDDAWHIVMARPTAPK